MFCSNFLYNNFMTIFHILLTISSISSRLKMGLWLLLEDWAYWRMSVWLFSAQLHLVLAALHNYKDMARTPARSLSICGRSLSRDRLQKLTLLFTTKSQRQWLLTRQGTFSRLTFQLGRGRGVFRQTLPDKTQAEDPQGHYSGQLHDWWTLDTRQHRTEPGLLLHWVKLQ